MKVYLWVHCQWLLLTPDMKCSLPCTYKFTTHDVLSMRISQAFSIHSCNPLSVPFNISWKSMKLYSTSFYKNIRAVYIKTLLRHSIYSKWWTILKHVKFLIKSLHLKIITTPPAKALYEHVSGKLRIIRTLNTDRLHIWIIHPATSTMVRQVVGRFLQRFWWVWWLFRYPLQALIGLKGGRCMDKVMMQMNNLENFGSENFNSQKQASK